MTPALAARMLLVREWLGPRRRLRAWRDRVRFLRDLARYRALPGAEPIDPSDLYPCLGEWGPSSPLDPHYFHLGVWATKRIAAARPSLHVDVGSQVNWVGSLTALTRVQFIDIRPLDVDIEGLEPVAGSVLSIPHPDRSVASLSCLHVAEHVGLGRYGDPLEPSGTLKAARELARVLAPGGMLLFALPVGRPRVCFNAHRVHSVEKILEYFDGLRLDELSGVDDAGRYRENAAASDFAGARFACGFFRFSRP